LIGVLLLCKEVSEKPLRLTAVSQLSYKESSGREKIKTTKEENWMKDMLMRIAHFLLTIPLKGVQGVGQNEGNMLTDKCCRQMAVHRML